MQLLQATRPAAASMANTAGGSPFSQAYISLSLCLSRVPGPARPAGLGASVRFGPDIAPVDFSGLRPILAQRLGWTSGRGRIPFDPVSMFLFHGWLTTNRWKRAQGLKNLADPRYADYRERFGFEEGVYPTEGGVRHFLTALGRHSESAGMRFVSNWRTNRPSKSHPVSQPTAGGRRAIDPPGRPFQS